LTELQTPASEPDDSPARDETNGMQPTDAMADGDMATDTGPADAARADGRVPGPGHRHVGEARGAGAGSQERRRGVVVGGRRQVHLAVETSEGKVKEAAFADALAEEVLSRLVRAQLSKGPLVKGKQTYKIRVDNASPLLLNGVAVQGAVGAAGEPPKVLSGISLSPFKNMTVPATGEMVEELGLKKGIRVIAADLSGL